MYTPIVLAALGMIGILLHNLVKLDSLNRAANGKVNFWAYLAVERFSIIISILVVAAATVTSHEVKELANAGKWLGGGFVAIGYLAQSILVKLMGNAQKYLNKINKFETITNTETTVQYVNCGSVNDIVSKYNGAPITTTPLPTVQQWAIANGYTIWDSNNAALFPALGKINGEPFTIVIAAKHEESTEYAGGRPPIKPR